MAYEALRGLRHWGGQGMRTVCGVALLAATCAAQAPPTAPATAPNSAETKPAEPAKPAEPPKETPEEAAKREATVKQVQELVNKIRTEDEAGHYEEAIKLAHEAVKLDPKSYQLHYILAFLNEEARNFDESVKYFTEALLLNPGAVTMIDRRGNVHFKQGKFKEALKDYDQFLRLQPEQSAHHWRRGIALYYAGEYAEGRKQFEAHKHVNPDDVENSAWHFLCVAKLEGAEAARKALLPTDGDSRVPMKEIYSLFAGAAKPEDVLAACERGMPSETDLKNRLFYAHLYLGLYYEATGDAAKAREHLLLAADKFPQKHYMGTVASVHAALLREKP